MNGEITIDEAHAGMKLIDVRDGGKAEVLSKTRNSVEVKLYKTSSKGIDCINWFEESWFKRHFCRG